MKRLIMNDLLRWKDDKGRKPLLLTGVRQCGKTTILKVFGNEYFDDVAYVNLEQNPQLASIFDYDLNPERIIRDLNMLFLNKEIIVGKTLLILDEIQKVPNAITALKYFNEDLPQLHVIGAGSLLGISLRNQQASFPVGKVDRLEMFPMSFQEFLIAHHFEYTNPIITFKQVPKLYEESMIQLLKDYYLIGGMPEAVKLWIETKDYNKVSQFQEALIEDYKNDFVKHAPITEFTNLLEIYNAIVPQLSKDNQKFVFSKVKKSARAQTYEKSLEWLVDAGLIHLLKKVSYPDIPLDGHADHSFFKVYFCDVGLLSRKAGINNINDLNNLNNKGFFKGALTENFVLTELLNQNFKPYYWKSEHTAELDFLIQHHQNVIPIEAKSTINTQAKSFNVYLEKYEPPIGFKVSLKNLSQSAPNIVHLPLYLTYRIREFLS